MLTHGYVDHLSVQVCMSVKLDYTAGVPSLHDKFIHQFPQVHNIFQQEVFRAEASGSESLTGSIMTLVQMLCSGMSAWAMSLTSFWQAQETVALLHTSAFFLGLGFLCSMFEAVWCSLLNMEVSELNMWPHDVTKVYCISQMDPVAEFTLQCQYT